MKELIGNRIKSARRLAGFSLRELADALGGVVSHTAISKYEKGELMPDSKVLIALSKTLGVKTDYFLRPKTVEISNIEFRKKSSLTVKKVNAIKENIIDSIERYIELEGFLNINNAFVNPLANNAISSVEDVENAVRNLLDIWEIGINPIPNVIELLEDNEIKVIEIEADDKFDGLSGFANEAIPVIVINKNFSVERKRFTALHELAHLLLSFSEVLEHKQVESLCHYFAGAVLLPKTSIINELGEKRNSISLNELIIIKESYGISIQAIMARAKNLNIISTDQYTRFRIKVNQNPALKKEVGFGKYPGDENSRRFQQLLYRATAEEVISLSKAASLSNRRLAEFRDEYMAI